MKIFDNKRNKMEGLYDPRNEHDSCGLGFIANIKGRKSNDIVKKGIFILENLEHRGATGADPLVGDGAGMLTQIPHEMYSEEMKKSNVSLPDPGNYEDPSSVINPKSLTVGRAHVEPALGCLMPEAYFQFERVGFFKQDPSSGQDQLTYNRSVTLKDTWQKKS